MVRMSTSRRFLSAVADVYRPKPAIRPARSRHEEMQRAAGLA